MRYALLLGLLIACVSEPKQPLEFKGHQIGDSQWLQSCTSEQSDSTLVTCESPGDSLIGDIPVQVTYQFRNKRLNSVRAYFPALKFYEITGALEEKFGPGDATKEKSELTGGKITTAMFWMDKRSDLYVSFLRGEDRAVLMMSDTHDFSDLRRRDEAVQRAKKGL